MMRTVKAFKAAALAVAGICLLTAGVAMAQTATTTFDVTATVSDACAVSASDLSFGAYNPTLAIPTDATTTISVTCTLLTAYEIRLNAGLNGGGVTARQMMGPAPTDLLGYTLSRDLAHTLNWGETDGTDTVSAVGTGLAVPHTVFGRVGAAQNVNTGSFSDTITVTVVF